MRSFTVVALAFVLTGCAQMFDNNLFKNVDTPPKLSESDMKTVSVSDVKKQISDPNNAATFYTQLKNDPTALSNLQTNLTGKMDDPSNTPAQTVDTAQTLILVTAHGTDSSDVVNNAITQAGNLKSSNTSSISAAVISLMAGKTVQQIEDSLTQFQTMQSAFYAMQTSAVNPSTGLVDPVVFFGTASAATQGDLAQTGLVAAAADAMVLDAIAAGGTLLSLAQAINAGTYSDPATHTNMDNVSSALSSPQLAASNHYAYLSAVKSILPF